MFVKNILCKIRQLCAGLIILLPTFLYGQQDLLNCKTPEPDKAYYESVKQQYRNLNRTRQAVRSPVEVALSIKVLRKPSTPQKVNDGTIREWVNHMNEVFRPSMISFFLLNDSPVYIDSEKYYNFNTGDEEELTAQYDVDNAINMYFVESFKEPIGGYAYFPDESRQSNRIFVAYQYPDDAQNKIIPHELGHYFGLFHTFQGNGTRNEEVVSRDPEKANCDYSGDLICDTQADPYGKLIIIGRLNCSYPYEFYDNNNEQYTPPVDNLMSYYRNCGNLFTPGQYQLMNYGLSTRLSFANNADGYNILGMDNETSDRLITGRIVDKSGNELQKELCRATEAYVSFETASELNEELEVWLLTTTTKSRYKVGEGSTSPIKLDFTKVPEVYFNFRLQIVKKDSEEHGSLSQSSYFLMDVPTLSLSGDKEAFTGTSSSVDARFYGGEAVCTLVDNKGGKYIRELYNQPGIVPLGIPAIQETLTFTVDHIENKCGVGSGTGTAQITVSAVPTATQMELSLKNNYWCDEQTFEFYAVGNGLTPPVSEVSVVDEELKRLYTFAEFTTSDNKIILQRTEVLKMLPLKFRIAVSFEGLADEAVTDPIHRARNITPVFLNNERFIERGDTLLIELNSPLFEPAVIEFADGDKYFIERGEALIKLHTLDDRTYTIRDVQSLGCQAIDLGKSLSLKMNTSPKIDIIRENDICVGKEVTVKISKNGSLLSKNLKVIFYDEIDREISRSEGIVSNGELSFTIPEDLKHTGFYYIRMTTFGPHLSQKSNLFFIATLPSVELARVYDEKTVTEPFLKDIAGKMPLTLEFSGGRRLVLDTKTINQDLDSFPEGEHILKKAVNACGEKQITKRFIIDRKIKAADCVPTRLSGYASRDMISKVSLINSVTEDKVYERWDWATGVNSYTDYSGTIINLNQRTNYDLYIEDYSWVGLDYSGGWNTEIKAWIDTNRNGIFEKSEEIELTKSFFQSKAQITFHKNTGPGSYRMRVRSMSHYENIEVVGPCSNIKSGETEDYLLYVSDTPSPTLAIKTSKKIYCHTEQIQFTVNKKGGGSQEIDVELRDRRGNVLQRVGRFQNGTYSFYVEYPIEEEEQNLFMVAIDPDTESSVTSNLFGVFSPPEIELTGTITGTEGNPAEVLYHSKNGYKPKLTYIYSGLEKQSDVHTNNYSEALNSLRIELSLSGDVVPVRIEDQACGIGRVSGQTSVRVIEKQSSSKGKVSGLNYSGYYSCRNFVRMNPKFRTTGEFEKGNFFSIQLIGKNGRPVKNLSYRTVLNEEINIENVESYEPYKIRIVSKAPYHEFITGHIDELSDVNRTRIQHKKKYLIGDTDLVTFKSFGGGLLFKKENSELIYNANEKHFRSLEKFNLREQQLAILNSGVGFCDDDIQPSFANISVAERAKNVPLLIADPGSVCINSTLKLRMFSETALANDNIFEYEIYDSGNRIVRRGNGAADERYFSIENFGEGLDLQQTYTLRVNSTSPYLMSNVSKSFRFSPAVVAELSSVVDVNRVYIGDSVSVNVDLSGQGPWRVELDNGEVYENIVDPKFKIKVAATKGLSRIGIVSVTGSCGEGKTKGSVNIEGVQRPAIGLSPLASDIYCLSAEVSIDHALLEGEFIEQPNLILEMYDPEKEEYIFVKNILNPSGSTNFLIPKTALGKNVHARIRDTRSGIVSEMSENFFVKDTPKAFLTENITGFEGFSYGVPVKLDAVGSVTFSVNGGPPQTINSRNNGVHLFTVVLDKNVPSYQITSLSNECGKGEVINTGGLVTFLEDEAAKDMIVLYPNPVAGRERSLYIEMDRLLGKGIFDAAIINAKGSIVDEAKIEFDEIHRTIYTIPQLPQGSYFIRFTSNHLNIVKRFQVR